MNFQLSRGLKSGLENAVDKYYEDADLRVYLFANDNS